MDTDKLQKKVAKQASEIARLTQARSDHLSHVVRIRKILYNALKGSAGWEADALAELPTVQREEIARESRSTQT